MSNELNCDKSLNSMTVELAYSTLLWNRIESVTSWWGRFFVFCCG